MDRTLDEGIYTLNNIKRITKTIGSISPILDSMTMALFNVAFESLYLNYLDENINMLQLLKTNPSIETVTHLYDTLQTTYVTLSRLKEENKDTNISQLIKTMLSLYETAYEVTYPFVKEYRSKHFH